jgi:LCP family protein required for cell wall assembly
LSQKNSHSLLPTWLTILLSITFVVTGIAVSVFAFLTVEKVLAAAEEPLNPLEEAAMDAAATELPPLVQGGALPTPEPSQPTATPIPGVEGHEDDERITILLMGIDRRPGEPFISRTDTMMLVSVNQQAETVSILSVPRDLYVVIPGRGRDRINTAFVYGSQGNNPAGGADLAMQTVEYNLGVPIDHYMMIDFNAFIRSIDALGGITVDVPYDIYDPTYPSMNYGYDPLYIEAGTHEFDGATALKYARTRHQDSDFFRARRQQQVLLAVRDKVFSLGPAELLRQAPFLYQQVNDGIRTDLSLEQLIQLANALKDIPSESIRNEVLDQNYVYGYRTERGASVLILVNEQASPLIQELFFGN